MDTVARFLHQGPKVHRRNTEVIALVDGIDFLRAIEEAMARTQGPGDLIHILAWRCDAELDLQGRSAKDPGYEPLGEILARKAAQGVDVRVILDGSLLFSNFPPPGLTFLPRIAGHRDNALTAHKLRNWRVPGPIGPDSPVAIPAQASFAANGVMVDVPSPSRHS